MPFVLCLIETMAVPQHSSCDSQRKELIVQDWLMLQSAQASHPAELGSPKETDTFESERQKKGGQGLSQFKLLAAMC